MLVYLKQDNPRLQAFGRYKNHDSQSQRVIFVLKKYPTKKYPTNRYRETVANKQTYKHTNRSDSHRVVDDDNSFR